MVNIPAVNAPYLSVSNLEITILGDETLTVAAGRARNSSNENDIILDALVTVSNLEVGLNGIDTGTVQASKVYALYVVGDSSQNNPTGAMLSLNQSSPLIPSGYDMYRLIGYAVTDATSDFYMGYFYGSANDRRFVYDSPQASDITGGSSGTYAAATLTAVVPAKENIPVLFNLNWNANAAGDTMGLQPFGATGDTFSNIAGVAGGTAHTIMFPTVMAQLDSGVPKVKYKVSAGTIAINVSGFSYSI
jgi:hypothetical protein